MCYKVDNLIVVLGHTNDLNGVLSEVACSRLDVAHRAYKQLSNAAILLTGGFGEHFNQTDQPHAAYAKAYLLSQGVEEGAIVSQFVLSHNTVEDGKLSAPIVATLNPKQVRLVTSDFHMPRALFIFQRTLPAFSLEAEIARSPVTPAVFAKLSQHEEKQLERLKTGAIL